MTMTMPKYFGYRLDSLLKYSKMNLFIDVKEL